MIIDLILDRKNDIETFNELYNPKTFYNEILGYADMFCCDSAENIAFKIAKAMDEGTEEEVKQQLCSYVKDYGYNDDICKFINSVEWLKPQCNYRKIELPQYVINIIITSLNNSKEDFKQQKDLFAVQQYNKIINFFENL